MDSSTPKLSIDNILCNMLSYVCLASTRMRTVEVICKLEVHFAFDMPCKMYLIKLKRLLSNGKLPEMRIMYIEQDRIAHVHQYGEHDPYFGNLAADLEICTSALPTYIKSESTRINAMFYTPSSD